jgi:signal transduction histidine kinase
MTAGRGTDVRQRRSAARVSLAALAIVLSLGALFITAATGWGAPVDGPVCCAPAGRGAADDNFFANLMKVYVPRRMCMYEETPLIWLHVVTDAVIAVAYYSIPVALIYLVRHRKDLAFNWIFLCFAVFITACGATHVLDVLAIWQPMYRLDGVVKLVTAVASVGTAVALWFLMPKLLALPSPTQLRNANKELETFCYSVSHDLRAPLRSIDGFSQALLESSGGKLDAEGQDHLRRIRAASQRMACLIDDLLHLSKVTQAEMKLQSVDVTRLASEVAQELRDAAPGRDVELTIAPGLTANADPGLLRIALQNLLGNAWKFTAKLPGKARVELGSALNGGARAFFIRDNGVGFDMAYTGKLFGPFQRLHTPQEFPGTGIGLATVQRIVHRHGGRIWAESAVGSGATFYFTL